jgi:RNA polymerase sigma factor (sigma-70 family)
VRADEAVIMTITAAPAVPDSTAARFAQEVAPHLEVLARGARRRALCGADADDLVQDTLLRAFVGFHTFQPGTNFRAWLFRIMHNQWITTYRVKQARAHEVLIGHDQELSGETLRGATRSAEAELLETMPESDLRAAMATLPDGFADVLYYADVEGYTYAETAEILGIPAGTVMSRIHRARRRLRLALRAPARRDTPRMSA